MKKKYNYWTHIFDFLAVILGVYLAFYINDQAQNNQRVKEGKALMAAMVDELDQDIQIYEAYHLPVNKQHEKNIELLVEKIMEGEENLGEYLSGVVELENYRPASSTYKSMKDSGKLSLIDNLDLQRELNSYYDNLAIESERKGDFQADYLTGEILTWLTNNVDLITDEILHPKELVPFRNKLLIYTSIVNQKIASYEEVVERAKALKGLLEEEMKDKP
jgi:hypothetical protein